MASTKSSFEHFAQQYFKRPIVVKKGLDDVYRAYVSQDNVDTFLCDLPGDIEGPAGRSTISEFLERWSNVIGWALNDPRHIRKGADLSPEELLDLHEKVVSVREKGHPTYEATRAEVLSRMSWKGAG